MDGVAARKFNQCSILIAAFNYRLSLWSSAWYDMWPLLYVLFVSLSCLHLSGIQILYHSYAHLGNYKPLDPNVFVFFDILLLLVPLLSVKATKRLMKSARGFCVSITWFPILSLLSACWMRLGFSQTICSTSLSAYFALFVVPIREWFRCLQSHSGNSSISPSSLYLLSSNLFPWWPSSIVRRASFTLMRRKEQLKRTKSISFFVC